MRMYPRGATDPLPIARLPPEPLPGDVPAPSHSSSSRCHPPRPTRVPSLVRAQSYGNQCWSVGRMIFLSWKYKVVAWRGPQSFVTVCPAACSFTYAGSHRLSS